MRSERDTDPVNAIVMTGTEKRAKAVQLRDEGMKWEDIAKTLGYAGASSAFNAAAQCRDPDYWYRREGRARPRPFDLRTGVLTMLPAEEHQFARDVLRHDICAYCGSRSAAHLDHIDPRKLGGHDGWENEVAACAECNGSKCATPLLRFLGSRIARQALRDAWATYAGWVGATPDPTFNDLRGNARQY